MTPEQIDREEHRRVKILALAASRRPHLKVAKNYEPDQAAPSKRLAIKRKRGRAVLSVGRFQLGFSSSAALGDIVRKSIVNEEERMAQHGPVRVLWKDGKPVDPA